MGDERSWDRGSGNRLTGYDRHRFAGDTLLDRVGRAVCGAGCLPRKELYEAWEVARRVRRRFRGGRVVELACGHGLLAHLLLLLDDTSPTALAVDRTPPPSAAKLAAALVEHWPRLGERVVVRAGELEAVGLGPGDLVVSVHACGGLTDRVLERAVDAGARVAVLPCCHHLDRADRGGLEGWLPGPEAVDVTRAARLRERGYRVHTARIPAEITPQNRLLLGEPARPSPASAPPPPGPTRVPPRS